MNTNLALRARTQVLKNAAFDFSLPESMSKTISLPLGQGGVGNLTINGLNAGGLDTFTKLHFGPSDENNQSLVTSLGMSSARLGIDLALSLTLPEKIGNGTIALSAPQLSNQAKAGVVVNDFEIDLDIFAAVSKQVLSNFSLGQYVELGCWVGATDSLNITSMMLNMTGTWCSSVKRENFNHFICCNCYLSLKLQEYRSLAPHDIARKSTLESTIKYYEKINSHARTQVRRKQVTH